MYSVGYSKTFWGAEILGFGGKTGYSAQPSQNRIHKQLCGRIWGDWWIFRSSHTAHDWTPLPFSIATGKRNRQYKDVGERVSANLVSRYSYTHNRPRTSTGTCPHIRPQTRISTHTCLCQNNCIHSCTHICAYTCPRTCTVHILIHVLAHVLPIAMILCNCTIYTPR